MAGVTDPGYNSCSPITIALSQGTYGRGWGVGRGEGGGGTGVMCGGGVGRGAGVPALVRGVGVGRVGGFVLHGGAHNAPSLYSVRASTCGDVTLVERNPLPTGGTTRFPIKASTSCSFSWIQLASAPLAILSFAAISWCARETNPLMRTSVSRMDCNSCRL